MNYVFCMPSSHSQTNLHLCFSEEKLTNDYRSQNGKAQINEKEIANEKQQYKSGQFILSTFYNNKDHKGDWSDIHKQSLV